MSEQIEMITASDLKPLLDELNEMRAIAETLKGISQPMFQGKHYLTDSALSQRLNICKRTLAIQDKNHVQRLLQCHLPHFARICVGE